MSQEKDLVTMIGEALSKKKQESRENVSQVEAPITAQPLIAEGSNQPAIGQPKPAQMLNPASMRPKNTRSQTSIAGNQP